MNRKTHLANTLSVAQMKAQYDSEAKKIVADKKILSRIIKEAVEEMKACDLEEIAEAIEKVEISEVPIYPGRKPQAITGMQSEDKVPNEGEITFDIRFYVVTSKGERIKLILNVEIQKDYYSGYDLLSAVMIGLNKDSFRHPQTELHGMLGTVFSEELRPEEKLEILSSEYQMETTEETKEGVNVMCNLSDAIEERGIRKGEELGLRKGEVRGEQRKLIEQVCRKVQKNKALSVIAEELEEEEGFIKPIYEAVLQSAPDYDSNKIYDLLNEGRL